MSYGNAEIRKKNKEILKSIPYIIDFDKHGTSRRRYKRVCQRCGKEEWVNPQTITFGRKECRKCFNKNKTVNNKTRKKISKTLRAKYTSPSYRKMVADAQKIKAGEDHWNWQGGLTSINQRDRTSVKYKIWRKAVFKRDLYHCRICMKNKDNLIAHHIIGWATDISKRFDTSNGITLCADCHKTIHLYIKEINKNVK